MRALSKGSTRSRKPRSEHAIHLAIKSVGGTVRVNGLRARIAITEAEGANDRLIVNGQSGDDVLDARGLDAGLVSLTLNGALGADLRRGSDGDDLITDGDGDDTAWMGAGDDVFVWNPGDDNDGIEGQAGTDTLLFHGANVAETVNISANEGRFLFLRNVANVTMDANDTEEIVFNALGGADTITVGDLSATDAHTVRLNLGGADGQSDTVVIDATDASDVIQIVDDASGVRVIGLAATIEIASFDANDRLVISGLGDDDVVDASGL